MFLMAGPEKTIDCLVCGLATVDIVAWPVPLDQPIADIGLVRAERILMTTGGLVSNSGIALAKLGARTAVLASVGSDFHSDFVRQRYSGAGLDIGGLLTCMDGRTSTTLVLVNSAGERSFIFDLGAAGMLNSRLVRAWRHQLSQSKYFLFGYFGLVQHWDEELPDMLAFVRAKGCKTALDAAGRGGEFARLKPILPHLDLYVPSLHEAQHQTGERDPRAMIDTFRKAGAGGLVGIKLGAQGALLSPTAGEFLKIAPVSPPGPVVDTTGAGDAFYAGLIAGLARGMPVAHAGRLAAAAGACCVTGLGATEGLRGFVETWGLTGETSHPPDSRG
jgi:sugar/nucleoside kinase (ribokinase family)